MIITTKIGVGRYCGYDLEVLQVQCYDLGLGFWKVKSQAGKRVKIETMNVVLFL